MSQGPEDFSELAQYSLDRDSVRLLPEPFCRRHHVVVLGKVGPASPHAMVTVAVKLYGMAASNWYTSSTLLL
jgi:hypothetical protein